MTEVPIGATALTYVKSRLRGAVRYMRRPFNPRVPGINWYLSTFAAKHAIEIGGPSGILSDDGPLPIYKAIKSADNYNFSEKTIWGGEARQGNEFHFHRRKPAGKQFIGEATNLGVTADSKYDCIFASHCLEHVANPLRALAEWKRVISEGGLLLLIVPHKDGTFDWRRPVTTLSHVIFDYEKGVGEDDLTHLEEVLTLHDLEKDKGAGSKEDFRERCLRNYVYRAMHHHVFDTRLAVSMVEYAGFSIVRVDTFQPYHIIVVAQRLDNVPGRNPAEKRSYYDQSPFASDRIQLQNEHSLCRADNRED